MRKIGILSIILGVVLVACENNVKRTGENTDHVTIEETHHHDTLSGGVIELKDGEKWEINAEMKPYLKRGEELVNAFIEKGGENYSALSEELEVQNQKLIKSCTMEGQSHIELHKWLAPHLSLVAQLKKAGDASEASDIVHKIAQSYREFNHYFH